MTADFLNFRTSKTLCPFIYEIYFNLFFCHFNFGLFKRREREMRQQLEAQEEEVQNFKENFTSLQQEIEYKTLESIILIEWMLKLPLDHGTN